MSATDIKSAPRDITAHPPGLAMRRFKDVSFIFWGVIATFIGLGTLVALVGELVNDGGHRLTAAFFMSFPSSDPAQAGILSAWVGSILVIITTACIAIPIGVLAGIYLEEYAPKNVITSAIEIAVNNLAGVPSIIFRPAGSRLVRAGVRPICSANRSSPQASRSPC
jgi:phosphate transport system permease protein